MNVKNEIVKTSYIKFRPLEYFGIRVSTMVATVMACIPALVIVGALRDYPALSCLIAIALVAGTYSFIEYFRGGKYENERLELFISRLKSSFKKKNLNSDEIAKSVIKDDQTWYLPSGDTLIGFQLVDADTSHFETLIHELIPILPRAASVKFIRPQKPDFEVPPQLREKNVSRGEYYIFVRIPMQVVGNALSKNELKSRITSLVNTKVKLLSMKEIGAVAETTFFPFQYPTGKTPPLFRSSIEITQGLGKGVWPEKNIASLSLVQLPEKFVTRNFEQIFNTVSHLCSTVCVTVERIELSKIGKGYRNHFKKTHNNLEDNSIHTQTQGDSKPVKMHMGILIHGTQKEISQAIFDLDIACLSLGSDYAPIFGQDLGFLNKALSLYLPGSRPQFPFGFRLHTIDSLKELICYLPRPEYSRFLPDYDLVFRTNTNKLYSIKQDSKNPVAFISDMGAGKSLLLSLNIFAHILKKYIEQVAGCYIEIGGSFRFLMTDGLADVFFVLRTLDNGEISPFQDHPMRAFRAFGQRGQEAAIKWIKILCGLDDYSAEVSQKSEHVIAEVVSKFFDQPEDSLEVFYLFFKQVVLEKFPQAQNDPDHLWRTLGNNLARYVNKKRWGKIFCPAETKEFNYDKARFVYFSSFESKLDPEGIYKPFFTFAVFLSDLVAEKYSSNQANPCRVQFMIDEMNVLRKIIPDDLYVDLNSTSRKEGKIPMFATQQFVDITLDKNKWGEDKKFRVVKSIKRLWFYQFPGPDSTLAELLGTTVDDPLIEKIRSVSDSNLRLKTKGIYAWGYLDETKEVRQLFIETDRLTLWASTTHPGGIAVRESCLRTKLYSYWKTCELLSEKIWPIPEQTGIPKETLDKIVDVVLFGDQKNSKKLEELNLIEKQNKEQKGEIQND